MPLLVPLCSNFARITSRRQIPYAEEGDSQGTRRLREGARLRGVKMPANLKDKGIKFSVLAQEAIDWYVNHDRRDVRNFKGRMKFILEAFADRVADEIKPSDVADPDVIPLRGTFRLPRWYRSVGGVSETQSRWTQDTVSGFERLHGPGARCIRDTRRFLRRLQRGVGVKQLTKWLLRMNLMA